MNSLFFPSSLLTPSSLLQRPLQPHLHHSSSYSDYNFNIPYLRHRLPLSSTSLIRSFSSSEPPTETGPISVINFEELHEKDWSFLEESDPSNSVQRIISAAEIRDASRVLVSIGSEEFIDGLVDAGHDGAFKFDFLLVVHDSLFVLAGIKERHDKVKCWQGEIIYVPAKWAPFDVVFLWFLPALPFGLDQILGVLAGLCSSGARIIISHPQGREVLDKQRKNYPDVVISDLPDRRTLETVAASNSFELSEYVDEQGFYLAVLRFCKS